MNLRRLALLAVLAASSSGCGWLTATPIRADRGSTRPVLAEAELARKANAVCRRRTDALRALPAPRGRAASRRLFSRVIAIQRAEFRGLVALRPPPAIESEYARFVSASLELTRISERFYVAFVDKDAHARRRAIADADRISEAYDRAARGLGLACRQTA